MSYDPRDPDPMGMSAMTEKGALLMANAVLRRERDAARAQAEALAEALGTVTCPSWPIKDVGDCAEKVSPTDSGCPLCRALSDYRSNNR